MTTTTDRERVNANSNEHYIEVSEEFAYEMLGALPPAKHTSVAGYETFLVGEPMSHNRKGEPVYETFTIMRGDAIIKDPHCKVDQWYYMGLHAVNSNV